jgi:outer membrane protein OmpA-like peptidoglycan-associated protein
MLRPDSFRPLIAGVALVAAPALLGAQDCLGLHAPRSVPVMEVTSAFMRDGILEPSTLGVGATAGPLFGILETGADVDAGKSAFTANGIGATAGYRLTHRGFALCGGGTLTRESLSAGSSAAAGLFAAASHALPSPLKQVPIAAFGVVRIENRTTSPDAAADVSETGLALRVGLSSYPREWVGVRIWEDLAQGDHRFGMSISFNRNLRAPDADGDGVPDSLDACPNTPAGATVDSTGCQPDSDKDGVIDAVDACPDTPRGTPVDAKGCPLDSDKDGVFDTIDACPDTPAGTPVDAKGCPRDSDGDGVIDTIDACPNTPAGTKVDGTGCPLPPPDSDGDGVPDTLDACPATPAGTTVDAKGCPPVFENGASFTLVGVTFETSRAVLRSTSIPTLDEVAAKLLANPTVRVEISGHTDNTGNAAANQRLSQARAETVRAYFISKGIAAERLVAKGYGSTKPVATNGTIEGRAENRRVELTKID